MFTPAHTLSEEKGIAASTRFLSTMEGLGIYAQSAQTRSGWALGLLGAPARGPGMGEKTFRLGQRGGGFR